jgi:hypothetical protein
VRAIGMISIENANLETALAELFSRMIFVPLPVGRAIYLTPKSAMARIEIFENAANAVGLGRGDEEHQRKKGDALRRSLSLAGRANTLIGKRHGIIHDSWGLDSETDEVRRRSLGRPSKTDGPVPVEELNRLIDEFRLLIDDARALAAEFRESPPSLVDLRR